MEIRPTQIRNEDPAAVGAGTGGIDLMPFRQRKVCLIEAGHADAYDVRAVRSE